MSDQLQDKLSSGLGHYRVSVAERDVDLLLMEEFHASDAFVSWFCAKLGLLDVRGDGAWHMRFGFGWRNRPSVARQYRWSARRSVH
jgi:hypothetical protein